MTASPAETPGRPGTWPTARTILPRVYSVYPRLELGEAWRRATQALEDDSFDDPAQHDGYLTPDHFRQLSVWATARLLYAAAAPAQPGKATGDLWARAWTAALDGRIRVTAAYGRVSAISFDARLWSRGEVAIGRGPRRVLRIRRPGARAT